MKHDKVPYPSKGTGKRTTPKPPIRFTTDAEYITSNYKEMTVIEMSKHLKRCCNTVYEFMDANGLKPLRKGFGGRPKGIQVSKQEFFDVTRQRDFTWIV